MIELKDVVVITKPITGIYGSRIHMQGTQEKMRAFQQVIKEIKEDVGLMQSNDATYEFLHQDKESIQATAFRVSEQLHVPVLFF